MRKGLGLVALLAAFALVLPALPAQAVAGDFDNDGIPDKYDVWTKRAFTAPLDHLSTTDLTATIDGTQTSLPAALYWELGGSTTLSVVSADIKGQNVLGQRVYSGPVFITKATVRNLATLDLDAEVMIGVTLNTNARATAETGGALVDGDGICVSVKNLGGIVGDLEALSGQTVTLFNLAQVLDQVKGALDNLDFGACSFKLGVKNNGRLVEILNQHNWFFPGFGSADRVTASMFGSVNFDLTGWRVPLNINLGNLLRFNNGRLSASAVTTPPATAAASVADEPDPTELGTDDDEVTSDETTTDEEGSDDLAETTAEELDALESSDLGTTETATTDEEVAELESTVVEIASLESADAGT